MGVVPGPKELSTSEVNHYLHPLIDKFLQSYSTGTWYTCTYKYPHGRRSRSALAIEVSDLSEARKVSGHTSHSSKPFCMFCYLLKTDINNLDCMTWTEKIYMEVRDAAWAWKGATTKKAQKEIEKSMGIRWSELMRLPY